MTKAELRSFIFGMLPKEDIFHPRFIDACIEKALNEILWELFEADPLAIQRYVIRYGESVPITVTINPINNVYYSTIPVTYVPLRDKCSGVRRVTSVTQGNIKFFPMDQREFDLMYNANYAEVANTTRVGFIVANSIVEYYNMTAVLATAGVRMDIVQRFSAFNDTDTVLIPEFKDNQGLSFTDRVLKILQTTQPYPTLDNNMVEPAKTK
jgi:hypothetical protein